MKKVKVLPKGITKYGDRFRAKCRGVHLGLFKTVGQAKKAYDKALMSEEIQVRPMKHILVPDTQIVPNMKPEDLAHLKAAGELIAKEKPDVIVMIGDWFDFPSLSHYTTKKGAEGRRIYKDIEAGIEAMDLMMAPIRKAIKRSKTWRPRMDFFLGNHEERLQRYLNDHPELEKVLSYKNLQLERDWTVHDFLKPEVIDGLHYCHYFYQPLTGKPIGGTAANKLNKLKFSFVMGHVQTIDYARADLNNGNSIHGLVCGAFYTRFEHYKGYQANNHFRGLCILHDVREGQYDLEIVSIDRLLKGVK